MTTTEFAYRPYRVSRVLYTLFVGGLATVALVGEAWPVRGAGIAVAAGALTLLVRAATARLTIEPDALVVRNLLRTYRVPYADIEQVDTLAHVDIVRGRFGPIWRVPCVRVALRSGRAVRARAASGKRAEPAVAAVRALTA